MGKTERYWHTRDRAKKVEALMTIARIGDLASGAMKTGLSNKKHRSGGTTIMVGSSLNVCQLLAIVTTV